MWVKICGIMTMRAGVAAAEAGADAVGFIMTPSRRQISVERLQGLIPGLPAKIAKVGVFVNESPAEMMRIAAYTGLTHLQLHGDEEPGAIAAVDLPVIKAFRIKGPDDLQQLPDYRAAAGILLEPYVHGQPGGTGQSLDWTLIRWAHETLIKAGVQLSGPDEPLTPGRPKLILAGGLALENVDEAMREARPGGVDVSSGVESHGEKDVDKIYDFVDMVKGANL